jgi:hypothetical protein
LLIAGVLVVVRYAAESLSLEFVFSLSLPVRDSVVFLFHDFWAHVVVVLRVVLCFIIPFQLVIDGGFGELRRGW